MNKRIQKKQIKSWIDMTMKNTGLELPIYQEATNINMIYDFIRNVLIVDTKRVMQARKEMGTPVAMEEYVRAITLHELGHYLDREALLASIPRTMEIRSRKRDTPYFDRKKDIDLFKLDIEEHEMDFSFEETAWEHAAELNRNYAIVNWESFKQVKFESLLSYTAFYNRDLLIYQALLKKESNPLLVG